MCGSKDCTLILLERKDFDKYATIKRTSDFTGHYTICAVANKIKDQGNNLQFFSNLALKVNMKMGGDNYWLNSIVLDGLLGGTMHKNRTMIIGS
jgi:eukaryotic translation initiation factor 2C